MTKAKLQRIDAGVCNYAAQALWEQLAIKPRKAICDWVQQNIDLSYDATSHAAGKVELYPYQIEPLAATEDDAVKELTLMWGQRLGKSTVWKFSMLKRVHDGGLAGLVLYPSAELGYNTNRDTVLPLLQSLPSVKRDLALPGSKRKDAYHLPSSHSIIHFLGGGRQVVSYTANWTVLDECDFFATAKSDAEDENTDQLTALRIRMKTFPNRKLIVCSSPTSCGGTINENWKRGSRGTWNLRCLGCGALYPSNQLAYPKPDGTYAGLQWRKTEQGDVIPESIRWICPNCGREHTEDDAIAMNRSGMYLHDNPKNMQHRSYQAGALANPWLWHWWEIAEAQEKATDPNGKKFLQNTVKGMPYKHVREGDLSISIPDVLAAKRQAYPDNLSSELSLVCCGIDQQKSGLAGAKYYVYAVRGWDENGNSYLLKTGIANSTAELREIVAATYCGLPVALALVDQGGFANEQDLDPFVASMPNVLYYKGDDIKTLKNEPWKASETAKKLILANAVYYQVKLLDLLYGPPRPRGYRWLISENTPADYMTQVASVVPNGRMRNGDAFANWQSSSRRDYFDAEKMALVALDVACHFIPPQKFAHGNKPLFVRVEIFQALARAQKIGMATQK